MSGLPGEPSVPNPSGRNFRLDHDGHTFWEISRYGNPRFAINMADVNPVW